MNGKLVEVGDPRAWWETAVSDFAATSLPLKPEHIAEVFNLPRLHEDPFDRALIAQATVEDLTLLTSDEAIATYAGEHMRVLR